MKICTKCNVEKDETIFPKIGNICKECKNVYSKNFKRRLREINSEKVSSKKKEYYSNNKEKFKNWDSKNTNKKEYKKEYTKKNKEVLKEKQKEYYINNKESISLKVKNYYLENKETIQERQKVYYLDNKAIIKEKSLLYKKNNSEKINETRRLWHKNKIESDPLYRIKCSIRNLINSAFERKFTKKSKRTIEIIGCSYTEFKIYIENKFILNMNWNNHGDYWELDHITPLSWAKTDEEVYALNHYTNFQPLIKEINKIKSNYYSG